MDKREFADIVETPASFGKVEEAPATPSAEPAKVEGQPRDEVGRFAPKSTDEPKVEKTEPKPADTGVTPQPTPPVAQPSQPPPGYIPLAAVLDEREKRSAAIRERDELQRKLAEFERQKAQQPPPDFYADPDAAFEARFNSRFQEVLSPLQQQNQILQAKIAHMEAQSIFGSAEKLQEFKTFVSEGMERGDPEVKMLAAMMDASPEPFMAAKQWYERRNFDPAKERERLRAEVLAELQQKPNGQPAPAAPVTPPSMASVAAGGAPAKDVDMTPNGKFEQMFNR